MSGSEGTTESIASERNLDAVACMAAEGSGGGGERPTAGQQGEEAMRGGVEQEEEAARRGADKRFKSCVSERHEHDDV